MCVAVFLCMQELTSKLDKARREADDNTVRLEGELVTAQHDDACMQEGGGTQCILGMQVLINNESRTLDTMCSQHPESLITCAFVQFVLHVDSRRRQGRKQRGRMTRWSGAFLSSKRVPPSEDPPSSLRDAYAPRFFFDIENATPLGVSTH